MSVFAISVGQVGVGASGRYFSWPGRSLCQWSLFLSTRYELVSVVTICVGQVGVCASGHYFCRPDMSWCQWSLFVLAR